MKNFTNLVKQIYDRKIQLALCLLDFLLLPLALLTSILLRLGGHWDHHLDNALWLFLALPIWTIPIFIRLGLYKAVIRYLDEKIVLIVFFGVSLSVLILIALIEFVDISAFPKTSIIIFWVFALAYIGGTRLILRGILQKLRRGNSINIAIYGAGSAGIQTCLALQSGVEYNIAAFFDDDKSKWDRTIRGIHVYRPKDLPKILRQENIGQVILAIPSISQNRRKEIISIIEPLSIKISTLPGISELISGTVTVSDIKEVEIEDLLGRDPIQNDIQLMKKNIYNKSVLITGAGGSIGSELVRQISKLSPSTLILLDISEFALYTIDQEISNNFPSVNKITVLGSIDDEVLIDRLLIQHNVNTIYHAAAYKHVPIVEFNPIAGAKNNILGTYTLAKLALKNQVDTMVLISTDKAVRPANIMGATKRFAEMILQAFNSISTHTLFTMVRFGNVLGSSGSVVPLFKSQIRAGGPVTITHPDIIRYFMTIPEAVELVIQASNMTKGGEVFVLDMGEPIKIVDLARKMVHLSGFSVKESENHDGDIEIKFVGLRAGEKLYEELLIGNNPDKTDHPRIMKANDAYLEMAKLQNHLEELKKSVNAHATDKVIEILKSVVSDYAALNQHKSF